MDKIIRPQRLVALALLLLQPSASFAQDTLRFTPTVGYATFDVREPVAHIKPGTVLVSETNKGPYYERGGGAFPGEVGPFYVEGATTNDMLKVEIIEVRPNHYLAGSQIYSNFGGLATDSRLRLLNDPIPPRRYEWDINTSDMTATTKLPDSEMSEITIDLRPMLGRVSVAPRGDEAFSGLWPGDFGGNMDAPEIREGATVYLPIFHEGAYFYFGDGHARQGEGEVNGTGLETSMDVVLRIDVVKGRGYGAFDGNVEDAFPGCINPGENLGKVEAHLHRSPGCHRELPEHFGGGVSVVPLRFNQG